MAAKNILIIDDEVSFCHLVKMNLEMSGKFKVFMAFDGKEGVKMAKKIAPDAILLDVTMPRMDGFEVLASLKENPNTSAIPVLMLSANSEDSAKIKASKLYSASYITKPVSADELTSKIEWILGISQGKGSA